MADSLNVTEEVHESLNDGTSRRNTLHVGSPKEVLRQFRELGRTVHIVPQYGRLLERHGIRYVHLVENPLS